MAIGTLAAIGLGAAGIGSAISSSKQSSAAKKAAQVASDTSLQVAEKNNALAREIYDQNKSVLAPWQTSGLDAQTQINALIAGLPDGSEGPRDELLGDQRAAMDDYNALRAFLPGGASERMGFDAYKGSTQYESRLQEGLGAVRGGFSGQGTLQSGAALKELERYGQDYASNEYGKYLGGVTTALGAASDRVGQYNSLIGNDLSYRSAFINSMMPRLNALESVRNIGFNAAGAQTGVATNYGAMTTSNNQAAGDAVANAALYRASNTQSPIGNALSMFGGGLYGMGR